MNPNESAFPYTVFNLSPGNGEAFRQGVGGGLTKRELFAVLAMQGMLANNSLIGLTGSDAVYINSKERFSTLAVQAADALIQELGKEAKK